MKQLTISLVTIGEPHTIECIDRITKLTPDPFDLVVWYDTRTGLIDEVFLKQLFKRTDDVIILTKNKGPMVGNAFNVLYSETPYVTILSPDVMVMEDYYDKLMLPFIDNPKIGMVGEPSFDVYDAKKMNYLIGNVTDGAIHCPDMLITLKREAINAVGGISPSFKFYGYEYVELAGRLEANGWYHAIVLGMIDRKCLSKSSISTNKQMTGFAFRNELLMRQLRAKNFKGYAWWKSDLMLNEEIYWECVNTEELLLQNE